MFIEKFSTFYKTFVGIALFDWLPGQDKKLILEEKKNCFSRTISRLKVTYMFMTLATSLVVFWRNFYSNASCFSLLLLYLGNSQVSVYRTIGPTLVFISSPEPKAQRWAYSIPVEPSPVCACVSLCVNIFKHEYLRHQQADHNQYLSEASLGWGKGFSRFWSKSDQNSGFHGNR